MDCFQNMQSLILKIDVVQHVSFAVATSTNIETCIVKRLLFDAKYGLPKHWVSVQYVGTAVFAYRAPRYHVRFPLINAMFSFFGARTRYWHMAAITSVPNRPKYTPNRFHTGGKFRWPMLCLLERLETSSFYRALHPKRSSSASSLPRCILEFHRL